MSSTSISIRTSTSRGDETGSSGNVNGSIAGEASSKEAAGRPPTSNRPRTTSAPCWGRHIATPTAEDLVRNPGEELLLLGLFLALPRLR